MMREFTCIICPNGCEIRAEIEEKEGGAVEILSIEGAACKKGNAYVEQELKDPQRNIATSVLVKGGILPLYYIRNSGFRCDSAFDTCGFYFIFAAVSQNRQKA